MTSDLTRQRFVLIRSSERGEERFREEGETAQKVAGGGRKDA